MMYKIVNNLVEIDSSSRNNLPTRGHSKRFKQPLRRINSFKYSFNFTLWNKLSDQIVNCTTLHSFNSLINNMHK